MNTKSYTFAQQFARQKASAEKEDVPVIRNNDREGATSALLALVLTAADRLQKV